MSEQIPMNIEPTQEFKNGAALEIATNDADLVRGRPADCFWETDEAGESTVEHLLELMRGLGFSEADIQENRQLNGRLFLSRAVIHGATRGFAPGTKIDTQTGDIAAAT